MKIKRTAQPPQPQKFPPPIKSGAIGIDITHSHIKSDLLPVIKNVCSEEFSP